MRLKFVALLISVLLFSGYAKAYDFSAVCESGQRLYYNITSNVEPYTVEVSNSTDPTGNLVIPETVEYNGVTYSVTSIGGAFVLCCGLTSVTIPNSVTSIGSSAFSGCSGLTSVTIPNSVTSIGSGAFYGCNGLTAVYYAGTIAQWCGITFGDYSAQPLYFAHNLYVNSTLVTDLVVPDSVTEIKEYAFYRATSLSSVTIPNSVTSIGDFAFSGCNGLTAVYYAGTIAQWCGITFANYSAQPLYFAHNLYVNSTLVTDLVVPDSVTEIKEYAFYRATSLSSVTIPNSVTRIGSSAFDGCRGLISVAIGNSVTSIGNSALKNCSGLTEVTIPNSVASIGAYAFSNCSGLTTVNFNATNCTRMRYVWEADSLLSTLNIGENVTNIPDSAFFGCSGLTSITIPNSVASIGGYAFSNCSGLTTINFNAINCTTMGSSSYPVFNRCSSLSTLNIGENVTNIPSCAFRGCSGLTEVTIPNSVTSIGSSAFSGCSGLISVTIPNSVTSIGDLAFCGCTGLTSVTIPNSVTSIGGWAFSGCTGLTSVTIPNSVTSIGFDAFYRVRNIVYGGTATGSPWGALTVNGIFDGDFIYSDTERTNLAAYIGEGGSVVIPNSVTSIGQNAFYGCSGLTDVTIPNSVTIIGGGAFSGCSSLTAVNFNATNCTTMGSSSYPAFQNCNANAIINIGEGVTTIPDYAFSGLLGNGVLIIPNSVTSIGDYAFDGCRGLISVAIGNSVTDIGSDAFRGCTGLTSVAIPNSVTRIGDWAFSGCSGLTVVTIPNSVTSIGGSAFEDCSGLTSVSIPNSVTSIEPQVFCNCRGLTSVTIPNSVTSIGFNAFLGCSGLTSVSIGNSVTSIGNRAFSDCSGLTSVTIPNSVTSIGGSAFEDCSGLTSVSIGNSVTSIGGWAFSDCSGLTSVTIPNSVTSIGQYAFSGCSGLTSVSIGNSVTSIGRDAFSGCSGLTSVTIPNSVANIGNNAFLNCSGLTSVSIGNSVDSIYAYAFDHCSNLADIYVKSTIPPSVFSNTFNNYRSATLWVPCGYAEVYGEAAVWGNFNDIRESRAYQLSVESNNNILGTSNVTQQPNCEDGIAVISATANEHYRFVQWSDGNTENPRTVVVEGDTTYIAMFAIDQHTITVLSDDENLGSVVGGGSYDYGAEIQISAIANDHSYFVQWSDGNTDNPRTIIVTGDTTYTASFALDQHTITVLSDDETLGSVIGGGTYDYGTEIQISATASEGYAFLSWNDGNTDNPRTIIVEGDTTFTAIFDEARTVTLETSNSEMGTVIGSGVYAVGAVVEITAVPSEGYSFDHWIDVYNPSREINTDNPRTIVVSTDVTYMAVFTDVTGIKDNAVPEIAVFPNPTNDILNITSSETISEIEIVNMNGQVVRRVEINGDNAVCNVADLKAGVYIVRISTASATLSQRKFVKE